MFHNKLLIFALLLAGTTVICAQSVVNLSSAAFPEASAPVDLKIEDIEKKKTTTTSTTPVPEPTTTTTTTTTTPPPETTSTTPKTTTTTTTTTTTAAPPTTTSTSTTTTEPPKTTTTGAPNVTTTTPAPAPFPAPSIGQWNSSCILVKMAAQLNFTYITKDNKTANALYNIPVDSKVYDSDCSSATIQTIQVNWGPAEAQHSFLLQFDKKNESALLTMIKINLPLLSDNFPDAKENETINLLHFGNDFDTPMKMSYHCTRAQKFNLTETVLDKKIVGTITVSDVQTEAFRVNNSTGFSTVHDCDSSETSDMVPIAVGCALAALILIVLISYLCARRRSTSRGYMSF